jgi:hypothetical protein
MSAPEPLWPFAAFATAQKVADAVLCEGQVLYPYRASARKNQLRWQFGVLAPRAFCEAEGSDRWYMRARCLLDAASPSAQLVARARFFRLRERTVTSEGAPVVSIEVGGELLTSFEETVLEEIDAGPVSLGDLLAAPLERRFSLAGEERREKVEPGGGPPGEVAVSYRERPLVGRLVLSAEPVPGPYGLSLVSAGVENLTAWSPPLDSAAPGRLRQDALGQSLVSTHILLGTSEGRWLSAVEPPEFAAGLAGNSGQEGCFPVLIGDDRVVLAAPIILYDHPEVAPESTGDFCDATEIDEILALRTLTLTEEEKREARATDARAAEILDRCDTMPPEIWARLHGAIRSMRPAGEPEPGEDSVLIGSARVRSGSRVRLRPSRFADAQDAFLEGKEATVTGVFRDLDDEVHLAVTLDGDPGADLHAWYGRYRYFRPWEVEVLS